MNLEREAAKKKNPNKTAKSVVGTKVKFSLKT